MKITGIIAEYNPFHKGHIYHLQKTREITQCDCLAVIITGCFSQRGLPSLMPVHIKTQLALQYGANLVLECPVCYGSQSADYFAKYNIQSLSCLNIDSLCFGSETNDLDWLMEQQNLIESHKINPAKSINQNLSTMLRPNDQLGVQYIKYCQEFNIQPITIQRMPQFKSATLTRHEYRNGIQQDFDSYFCKEQHWQSYYPYLRYTLQITSCHDLSKFHLVTEGIEYRLKKISKECDTWDDFLLRCTTKTYSKARIQRTCLMILLQIKKEQMENASFFELKVLGFDSIGKKALKNAKTKPLTRYRDFSNFLTEIDQKSHFLYNSVMNHPNSIQGVIQYDR